MRSSSEAEHNKNGTVSISVCKVFHLQMHSLIVASEFNLILGVKWRLFCCWSARPFLSFAMNLWYCTQWAGLGQESVWFWLLWIPFWSYSCLEIHFCSYSSKQTFFFLLANMFKIYVCVCTMHAHICFHTCHREETILWQVSNPSHYFSGKR